MKGKVMSTLLAFGMAVSMFAGCGADNKAKVDGTADKNTNAGELAFVIGAEAIGDNSLNESVWEGIKKYGEEKKVSYQYYQASETEEEAFEEAIEKAIEDGAKVVVCQGDSFEIPVYRMQTSYPDVKFILMDGQPNDGEIYETAENTMTVSYQEEQAGFLAGYAAVKDGYTSLGFIGGNECPAVVRYGFGYLAGAEYAAQEMDVDVMVTYTYAGTSDASLEAEATASGWYNAGIEVIFTCGGAVLDSVVAAAEANSGKVIGEGVEPANKSEVVISHAMKMFSDTAYTAVSSVYDGTFAGGETMVFDITNDGVGLAMENAQWTSFTQNDYEMVCTKLAAGEITFANDTDKDVTDLVFSRVMVNYVQQ